MMALGSNMGSVPPSAGNNHRVDNGLMPEGHHIAGSVTCRFAGRTMGLRRPAVAVRPECRALWGWLGGSRIRRSAAKAVGAARAAEIAVGGKSAAPRALWVHPARPTQIFIQKILVLEVDMICDRDKRQALATHKVMAAALERDRLGALARRQDEHVAREKADRREKRP
jgi:hypothetical protein